MTANPASETINRLLPGWMVEVVGGHAIPLEERSLGEGASTVVLREDARQPPAGSSETLPPG